MTKAIRTQDEVVAQFQSLLADRQPFIVVHFAADLYTIELLDRKEDHLDERLEHHLLFPTGRIMPALSKLMDVHVTFWVVPWQDEANMVALCVNAQDAPRLYLLPQGDTIALSIALTRAEVEARIAKYLDQKMPFSIEYLVDTIYEVVPLNEGQAGLIERHPSHSRAVKPDQAVAILQKLLDARVFFSAIPRANEVGIIVNYRHAPVLDSAISRAGEANAEVKT